ncbi:MAG: hypothetical protein EBZ16_00935, partial [Flavobacteriia bacterium]|nr:hypothetical protein [Flavobacteriia bacterium]
GAYFGDKMSPFSDTTNLAPAMAGTDLMTHIRYMTLTSGPAIVLTLIAFSLLGMNGSGGSLSDLDLLTEELSARVTISPWLMLIPALSIGLIIYKVDAIVAMGIGTLAGLFAAYFFQYDLLVDLTLERLGVDSFDWIHIYQQLFISTYGDTQIAMSNPLLNDLMESGGMAGMLGTIWLIICAMTFGGTLAASGFLEVITELFLRMAHGTAGLIVATLVTCGFFNATAADQYLAIVVPGRMFRKAYEDRGLAPENLSRALEDSGTVTSVLVPWNTCGAYQPKHPSHTSDHDTEHDEVTVLGFCFGHILKVHPIQASQKGNGQKNGAKHGQHPHDFVRPLSHTRQVQRLQRIEHRPKRIHAVDALHGLIPYIPEIGMVLDLDEGRGFDIAQYFFHWNQGAAQKG